MKKTLAFIVVIVLSLLIILELNNNDLFPKFGDVDLTQRVSYRYVTKNLDFPVIFGETQNPESGPANIITSIIVDYRSFDTLGEVSVLFISSFGVAFLLGSGHIVKRLDLNLKPNFMLRVGAKPLFAIILMTGVYITLHGHLTPGGGFPGGAMIASSILLLYLADQQFRAKIKGFKLLESISGTLYVAIGLIGLIFANYFLRNFLPTGTVGNLFSSGIIPIIYVLVGLKVGSEISGIVDSFLTTEEPI